MDTVTIELTEAERQTLVNTVEVMNYPGKSAELIAALLKKLRDL